MSGQPLISVILPTYNRMQYLPAAVESVLAQTYGNWELIIADDGSEAPTREYLRGLQRDSRVSLMWRAHSANPGAARNAALQVSQGEYVAFIDSDDTWMRNKLETQLAAMLASPQCQWSYTDHIAVDSRGESIDSRRNPERALHRGWVVERLLELRAGIALPTVMATTAILRRVGGFDEAQGLHEDYDLWLRLALLSEVGLVAQPLSCIRTHDEHFSSGGPRNYQARARVLDRMALLVTTSSQLRALQRARTRNAVSLAATQAVTGDTGAVLRTLAESWQYSRRLGSWYYGGARAVARSVTPPWLLGAVRRSRTQ